MLHCLRRFQALPLLLYIVCVRMRDIVAIGQFKRSPSETSMSTLGIEIINMCTKQTSTACLLADRMTRGSECLFFL